MATLIDSISCHPKPSRSYLRVISGQFLLRERTRPRIGRTSLRGYYGTPYDSGPKYGSGGGDQYGYGPVPHG
jgi:hypothetical protein